jgi:hypothetical protein
MEWPPSAEEVRPAGQMVRRRPGPLRVWRPLPGGDTGFALRLPMVGLKILF